MKLKTSHLLNFSLRIYPLFFIPKRSVLLLLLCSLYVSFHSKYGVNFGIFAWRAHVTKAMPIQFIDSNKLKSCKMGLTNHTQPISHHIMLLVIDGIRGGHTHTAARTKIISRNQAASGLIVLLKHFNNKTYTKSVVNIWPLSIYGKVSNFPYCLHQ